MPISRSAIFAASKRVYRPKMFDRQAVQLIVVPSVHIFQHPYLQSGKCRDYGDSMFVVDAYKYPPECVVYVDNDGDLCVDEEVRGRTTLWEEVAESLQARSQSAEYYQRRLQRMQAVCVDYHHAFDAGLFQEILPRLESLSTDKDYAQFARWFNSLIVELFDQNIRRVRDVRRQLATGGIRRRSAVTYCDNMLIRMRNDKAAIEYIRQCVAARQDQRQLACVIEACVLRMQSLRSTIARAAIDTLPAASHHHVFIDVDYNLARFDIRDREVRSQVQELFQWLSQVIVNEIAFGQTRREMVIGYDDDAKAITLRLTGAEFTMGQLSHIAQAFGAIRWGVDAETDTDGQVRTVHFRPSRGHLAEHRLEESIVGTGLRRQLTEPQDTSQSLSGLFGHGAQG